MKFLQFIIIKMKPKIQCVYHYFSSIILLQKDNNKYVFFIPSKNMKKMHYKLKLMKTISLQTCTIQQKQ